MEQEAILASEAWVNAGGMILLVVGLSLIVLEFFLPSFGLFGFAGASATLIGVIQLHQTGYIEKMPVSIETLFILALIGFALAAAGGYYTFKLYQKKNTTGIEAMLGETATVIQWNSKKGRIIIEGEEWQAYADEVYRLAQGDEVFVSKVNGLRIKITYTDSKH